MANALLRFIEKVCVQSVWYWSKSDITPDGFGGYIYALPTIVKCRWDGKTELVIGPDGKEMVSTGQLLVLQEMVVGDKVSLISPGKDSDSDKLDADGSTAHMIIAVSSTPLIMSDSDFVRMAYV